MSKARLLASWTIGLATVLLAAPCQAQGNIDRGKTPAQVFADTCAVCHRGPRALKRTNAEFLRVHYAASSAQASAMAAYLASLPRELAQHPKRPPSDAAETLADAAKQQPIARIADQAETDQSQPSGERLPNEVTAAPPVADSSPVPAPPPTPVLEPFEE
jgi:hypothetical protein